MQIYAHVTIYTSGPFVKEGQWERWRSKRKLTFGSRHRRRFCGGPGLSPPSPAPEKCLNCVCEILQSSAFSAGKWLAMLSIVRLIMRTAIPPAPNQSEWSLSVFRSDCSRRRKTHDGQTHRFCLMQSRRPYCNWHSTHFPGWRRGSVVRTSDFGWRTFPDLRLIYGWHVTTLWVMCPPWINQPGQLSLPSLKDRQNE